MQPYKKKSKLSRKQVMNQLDTNKFENIEDKSRAKFVSTPYTQEETQEYLNSELPNGSNGDIFYVAYVTDLLKHPTQIIGVFDTIQKAHKALYQFKRSSSYEMEVGESNLKVEECHKNELKFDLSDPTGDLSDLKVDDIIIRDDSTLHD